MGDLRHLVACRSPDLAAGSPYRAKLSAKLQLLIAEAGDEPTCRSGRMLDDMIQFLENKPFHVLEFPMVVLCYCAYMTNSF